MSFSWEKTHVGQHLISTFNGRSGYKSKSPQKIYWYFWREAKRDHPDEKGPALMYDALSRIDGVMRANPYRLAMIHEHVQLRVIDDRVVNLPPHDPWHVDRTSVNRLRALVEVAVDEYWNKGSEILPLKELNDNICNAFGRSLEDRMSKRDIRKLYNQRMHRLMHMKVNDPKNKFHEPAPLVLMRGLTDKHGNPCVMGTHYYQMVIDLAGVLKAQADQPGIQATVGGFSSAISMTQSTLGITLSEEQRDCVKAMIEHPMSLVMGYAGTGKTTMLRAVVNYLENSGQSMMLTAISGKACANLLEKTRTQSSNVMTIAKLQILKKQGSKRLAKLKYLIIDEISMVDEATLLDLLQALPQGAHLIMLGDRAQLPAVGGVGVLTSLGTWRKLKHQYPSGFFYHELTHVYRQAQNSLLDAATVVRSEKTLTQFNNASLDSSLYYQGGFTVANVVDKLYPALRKHFDLDVNDITILSPTNAVVDQFDELLQAQLVDTKAHVSVPLHGRKGPANGRWQFALGDRVLVTKNMYGVDAINQISADLFNGFVGTVIGCYPQGGSDWGGQDSMFDEQHIVVEFGAENGFKSPVQVLMMDFDRPEGNAFKKHYDGNFGDLQNVQLGYALTVHKAQGSTMKTVIVYVSKARAYTMLTRELLYTALTRAHDRVIFVSDDPIDSQFFEPFIGHSVYDHTLSYLPIAMDSGMSMETHSDKDFLGRVVRQMNLMIGEN